MRSCAPPHSTLGSGGQRPWVPILISLSPPNGLGQVTSLLWASGSPPLMAAEDSQSSSIYGTLSHVGAATVRVLLGLWLLLSHPGSSQGAECAAPHLATEGALGLGGLSPPHKGPLAHGLPQPRADKRDLTRGQETWVQVHLVPQREGPSLRGFCNDKLGLTIPKSPVVLTSLSLHAQQAGKRPY